VKKVRGFAYQGKLVWDLVIAAYDKAIADFNMCISLSKELILTEMAKQALAQLQR